MTNANPTPNVGKDGQAAATFNMLIAGKTVGGTQKDVLVGSDGKLAVDGSAATQPTQETQPATGTTSTVASNATSLTLLASNASRRQAVLFNDSTQVLYVKFGTTASATDFTYRLNANATLELPQPVYTGRIDGVWASANGNARLTELT